MKNDSVVTWGICISPLCHCHTLDVSLRHCHKCHHEWREVVTCRNACAQTFNAFMVREDLLAGAW